MTLLTLFLIYLAGSLLASLSRRAAQDRAIAERRQAAEQRRLETERKAEQKQIEARQKQIEADRKAQLKAEQLRLKAEQAEHKAAHTRLMASQNIDSLTVQRQNTQSLYEQIEKQMDGNISEKQRIAYTRQLMALDDKMYRLDNKIADLMYKAETV